jgi:hypothetical protein
MDGAGEVNRKFIQAGGIYGACWELYGSGVFCEEITVALAFVPAECTAVDL